MQVIVDSGAPAHEIMLALALAFEENLAKQSSDRTYQIQRQVTITGLRQLADQEASW